MLTFVYFIPQSILVAVSNIYKCKVFNIITRVQLKQTPICANQVYQNAGNLKQKC